MKVALVYDRVNKWGGGERLLLAFQKLFPQAPLYTSVYNSKNAPWAKSFDVRTSFLQNIPFTSPSHEKLPLLMPIGFESFSFDEFDVVISITSEAAKGIITKPQTLHICYCLTPTRYLWSGYDEYFRNTVFKFISRPAVSYLRTWDKIAAKRPDVMVGISREVQSRIKKYYERESEVIYPPVELGASRQALATGSKEQKKTSAYSLVPSGYFLVVSRLVPYKRIDIAIRACNELKVPLKIIGTGSQESYLRSIAGSTVEFLGHLTDESIGEYYKNCAALLFPGEEDLGLTVLEATSFGKPVVAYKKGGALETVIDGETGILFAPQTSKSLEFALERMSKIRYNTETQGKILSQFSFATFKSKFIELLKKNTL